MHHRFAHWARAASNLVGSAHAFVVAALLIVLWLFSGPLFNFSDTWQLIINTSTTVITFLIVFLLQYAQNQDNRALHVKLDEILLAIKEADSTLIEIEQREENEVEAVRKRHHSIAHKSL